MATSAVVIRELFEHAERDVLVVGYSAFQSAELFGPLRERQQAIPELKVRLCLNIGRKGLEDRRPEGEVLAAFSAQLRRSIWPDAAIPPVYFDPRALELAGGVRACLHAKCVIVDGVASLVYSANFTEAAQDRNFEVGVLIRDAQFAQGLVNHFESLIDHGLLRRLDVAESPP